MGSECSNCCRRSGGLVLAHRNCGLEAAPHTIRQGPFCAGLILIQAEETFQVSELLMAGSRQAAWGCRKAQDIILTATF